MIPLHGRTVIPGIVDAHAHMEREGLKQLRISLAGLRTVGRNSRAHRRGSARRPKGRWIVTMPVGEPPFYFGGPDTLAEKRMPDRHELDRAAPDHPVCISGVFGNWGRPPGYTALNTLALRLNDIGRDSTPACAGVTIERDASGELTGIIVEHNNRPTVEFDLLRAVPKFLAADRLAAMRVSMQLYNAVGITSIYEGHGSAPETIACYRQLHEGNEMTVRTSLTVSPTWDDAAEADRAMRDWLAYAKGRGLGDEWLRVCGVFIGFGDDPVVARITRKALPDTGWTGFVESANSVEEYRAYVALAARHDLRVHTIVGDRLGEILPILEDVDRAPARRTSLGGRACRQNPSAGCAGARAPRNPRDDDSRLPALEECRPVSRRFRRRRVGGAAPVVVDAGIPVASGTDNIPYNPFFTVWAMVARKERTTGQVIGPGQRLDAEEALRLLTRNGAWLSFEETQQGDARNRQARRSCGPFPQSGDTAVDDLPQITSMLTMVGGRIVHHEPWD